MGGTAGIPDMALDGTGVVGYSSGKGSFLASPLGVVTDKDNC